MSWISLTTDFGSRDWFVGTMKGVIARIAPLTQVIDITHELPAGDLHGGAFALAASYAYFPKGTIHVVIVDPGVGSSRAAMTIKTENYLFVAPDNGVLAWALVKEKIQEIRQITNDDLFLHPVSRTFHGRDIFTPVAAHLAAGGALADVGPEVPDFQRLRWPEPRKAPGIIQGEIVYIDRFGNGLTNIPADWLPTTGTDRAFLTVANKKTAGLKSFYNAIPNNQVAGIVGSSGYLELAMNQESAEKQFGLQIGQRVTLHFSRRHAAR